MANNTTKKAGSNKSFIDRMGGQKFIVLLVVIALFIFFCAMSPNFRKYTTFINILDFSYYCPDGNWSSLSTDDRWC